MSDINLRDFMEGLSKLCRESTHPNQQVRDQLGSVAGLIDAALADSAVKVGETEELECGCVAPKGEGCKHDEDCDEL